MQADKQLTQFLKDNPNSSKAAISEATGLMDSFYSTS